MQEFKQPQLSPLILWIMTITTAFVVANNYYNQPLLPDIAQTFNINNGKAGQVAVVTQVGYAIGILFIVPLGDMFERKTLMLIDFVFMIAALLLAATANSFSLLLLNPLARNRINTIYIVSYFTGGAIGTYLATVAWEMNNWIGVCLVCLVLSGGALFIHLLNTDKPVGVPAAANLMLDLINTNTIN